MTNRKKLVVGTLMASVVVLAGMGMLFCSSHAKIFDYVGLDPCFSEQMVGNLSGLIAFVVAVLAGWKRCLKAMPIWGVAWLLCLLAAQLQPAVDGARSCLCLGPVRMEIWTLLPCVIALIGTWLSARYAIRTTRLLGLVGVAVMVALVVYIVSNSNPDNIARIVKFFNGGAPSGAPSEVAHIQQQCAQNFASAKWFSQGEMTRSFYLSGMFTHAMPITAAVFFGKWFILLVALLWGMVGLCLALLWHDTVDQSKKNYVLLFGLATLIPTVLGFCECFSLTPMLKTCIALCSYGRTAVFATWLGIGILVTTTINDNGLRISKGDPTSSTAVS